MTSLSTLVSFDRCMFVSVPTLNFIYDAENSRKRTYSLNS
uniref:Uncharacterized protein n=1 Tax=Anguilla anguilla TaxID=7936 RepID=A0A0E9XVD9_ANGAN